MKRNKQYYVRRAHRFLGVFLGVQFLLWTLGGLYFSWTNIDEIHGDHFVNEPLSPVFNSASLNLKLLSEIDVNSLELIEILDEPYFMVNQSRLFHAINGIERGGITEEEAVSIAKSKLKSDYPIKSMEYLEEVGKHHEFRGRSLPAWKIDFESADNIAVYINARNGTFERIRHTNWRWFDFLWMLHTMDYEGRDDINNVILRIFSLLGLVTVISGFTLFFMTSRRRVSKSH